MANTLRIDRQELRKLTEKGWKNAELAQHFGVSLSAIEKAKREAKLTAKRLEHSQALPWTIAPEHNAQPSASYLRHMSRAIQGDRNLPAPWLNTACNWAQRIVGAGRDIAYDRERGLPPAS